jgi:hypothetical protein
VSGGGSFEILSGYKSVEAFLFNQIAEKMYLPALQGYEKALGQEAIKTCIPVLHIA